MRACAFSRSASGRRKARSFRCPAQDGGTAFVKDSSGQVVKSKLDEKRLREIAETTGGMFFPLGSGPATMRKLYDEGLAKMQAGEIDTKMSRQPIERYQWPLGAALLALALPIARERTETRARKPRRTVSAKKTPALATAGVLLLSATWASAASPGLEAYRNEEFEKAYRSNSSRRWRSIPNTRATDKIQFDAGAAAYKMKDYGKALQSFSQALLSPNPELQSQSHYNLGNTLYQRGEGAKSRERKTPGLDERAPALRPDAEDRSGEQRGEREPRVRGEEDRRAEERNRSNSPARRHRHPRRRISRTRRQKKDQQDKDQQQQDQSGEGERQEQTRQEQKDSENKNEEQQARRKPHAFAAVRSRIKAPRPLRRPALRRSREQPLAFARRARRTSPSRVRTASALPSPSPGEGKTRKRAVRPRRAPLPSARRSKRLKGDVKGETTTSKNNRRKARRRRKKCPGRPNERTTGGASAAIDERRRGAGAAR